MTEPLAEDDGPDDDELERLTRYCDFWRKNGWAPSRPATIVETLAKLLKASRAEVAALKAENEQLHAAVMNNKRERDAAYAQQDILRAERDALRAACDAISSAYASNGNTQRQKAAFALVRAALAGEGKP